MSNLSDMCKYLKGFIVPSIPDSFTVAEPFRHGLTDSELMAGIDAFRNFTFPMKTTAM